MELVSTMEISGEEREIADAYAREQCAANAEGIDGINSNLTQQSTEAMDLKMLGWTVPKECPVQNYVDSDGVYHQIVGRVDLGSLNWSYISTINAFFYADLQGGKIGSDNAYCSKYNRSNATTYGAMSDKEFRLSLSSETVSRVFIKDLSYTDATTFKNSLKGIYLYYELATEITMNVDGNEAVTKVNDSLEDYGLKADKPELIQGFYNISNDGIYEENNTFLCNKNAISCESADKITVITEKECYCRIVFYNENTFVSSEVNSVKNKKNVYVVPENVTKANFYFAKGDGNAFNLSELGYCSVYHNNAIDGLKSDLSAYADGTKAVAKATTAESATKATQDGNGNIIADTYLRKTDSTNVLLPIGSMIMCNAEQISQYYGTWVDLGTTTITCTTGTGEDIMDVTYTTHVFNRTE